MNPYLIIGGGISGLVAARILEKKGLEFVALEKEERLGGRADFGHHRLYSETSVRFLSELSHFEWFRIDEEPHERKKGEWTKVHELENAAEKFYLGTSFFHPKTQFHELLNDLAEPVRHKFQLRKTVEKVLSQEKKVVCDDGSEYPYERLIWCTHLDLLRKVWDGDNTLLLKNLKKSGELFGGLSLDYALKQPIFPYKNSVVFQFRYKDKKLRAIGVTDSFASDPSNTSNVHWLLFLDEEISEDREEVAKCVRALKRELQKEFPELKESIAKEKIVYLPALSGDEATTIKSLEIAPSVFYIGPQAAIVEREPELKNIDRTLDNCLVFEKSLSEGAC